MGRQRGEGRGSGAEIRRREGLLPKLEQLDVMKPRHFLSADLLSWSRMVRRDVSLLPNRSRVSLRVKPDRVEAGQPSRISSSFAGPHGPGPIERGSTAVVLLLPRVSERLLSDRSPTAAQ